MHCPFRKDRDNQKVYGEQPQMSLYPPLLLLLITTKMYAALHGHKLSPHPTSKMIFPILSRIHFTEAFFKKQPIYAFLVPTRMHFLEIRALFLVLNKRAFQTGQQCTALYRILPLIIPPSSTLHPLLIIPTFQKE